MLFLFVIFCPQMARAASYNIYVDKSYDGDEEGTSDKPYKTLKKAVEKAESNGSGERKIHLKNGEYDGDLTLPKETELYGQEKAKVIIKGHDFNNLNLEGNNKLENLTVSGGMNALNLKGKTTVSGCIIKNAGKNGVNMTEGSSPVVIEKSELAYNAKGMYVQKGRAIDIVDNSIHDNDEEGIDIREKVRGSVIGNDVFSNGEGGIEIVVGSANLTIRGNDIKKNKASGIANQFYSSASKTGKITITKNTISRNGHYGMYCGAPSGGEGRPSNYWSDSLDVTNNKIELNKKKAISGSCDVVKAVTEEEKKTNETIESETAIKEEDKSAEEIVKQEQEEDVFKQEEEKETKNKETLAQIKSDKNRLWEEISNKKTEINKTNRFKSFFFGFDPKAVSPVKEYNEKIKANIAVLSELSNNTNLDEVKLDIDQLKNEMDGRLKENEAFVQQKEKSFSLFGWALRLFGI